MSLDSLESWIIVAVISSEEAEFAIAMLRSSLMFPLICERVACCSSMATAIERTISVVSLVPVAMDAIASLTVSVATLPRWESVEACSTMSAICLAFCAELSASFPTSCATTTKPLPCSPARAASIAALRERMCVRLRSGR